MKKILIFILGIFANLFCFGQDIGNERRIAFPSPTLYLQVTPYYHVLTVRVRTKQIFKFRFRSNSVSDDLLKQHGYFSKPAYDIEFHYLNKEYNEVKKLHVDDLVSIVYEEVFDDMLPGSFVYGLHFADGHLQKSVLNSSPLTIKDEFDNYIFNLKFISFFGRKIFMYGKIYSNPEVMELDKIYIPISKVKYFKYE